MAKNQPLPCPRPHQELIKAWADGAIIQFWSQGHGGASWDDVQNNCPTWLADLKYRVKPMLRTQYLSMVSSKESEKITVFAVRDTYTEATRDQTHAEKRIAWNPAGVIMFTSDPVTGKVLTAKVVK